MYYRDYMTRSRPLFAPDTEGAGGAAPAGGAGGESAAVAADAGAAAPSPAPDAGAAAAPPADASAAQAAGAAAAPQGEPSLLEQANTKPPADGAAADAKPAEGAKESPAPADAAKTEAKPEGEKKPEGAEAEAAKTDPDKKDATAEAQPPAPIQYQAFTLPEGVKLEAERLAAFTEVAGAAQVPQDVAQKMVDLHIAEMKRHADEVANQASEHQRNVWNSLNDTWKTDLRNDKELGGNRLDTSLSVAKAVIEEFGGTDEQVRELLAHTSNNGMGNYPGFVRLLHNIGQRLNVFEDGMVNANPTAPKPAKSAGNRGWYDKTSGNGAAAS